LSQLRQLLRQDTAGDPMGRRGLWTGQHLEEISGHLKALGLQVTELTVALRALRTGEALAIGVQSVA